MFGQASDEEINIEAVVKAHGYADEATFMAKLQEIIQKAQDAQDINEAIKLLKAFSKMAQKMDNAIVKEFGRNNGNGQ